MLALPLLGASPRPAPRTPAPGRPLHRATAYGVRVLSRATRGGGGDAGRRLRQPAPGARLTATPTPGPAPAPALVGAARAEVRSVAERQDRSEPLHPRKHARKFTDSAVNQISSKYLRPLGPVKTFTFVHQMVVGGMVVYVFRAACAANGTLDELDLVE